MFIDTDLKHDMTIKQQPPKEKKPYKPSNKQIFVGYKEIKKKTKK